MSLPVPWDDALADAVALVEAQLRDDGNTAGDVAALLRHGNPFSQAVVLSKLLSEVVREQDVSGEHLRTWARQAANRS